MSSRIAVPVACVGFFMVVLDTTVVNVALPTIQANLVGGVAGSQWIIDAYTLTFGALVLSAGHASDRIGASVGSGIRVAVFAMSSALCLSPRSRCRPRSFFCSPAAAAQLHQLRRERARV